MKIAATITDVGGAANVGAGVEHRTEIIDIPDELLPTKLRAELERRQTGGFTYNYITSSILAEDEQKESQHEQAD